jgi:FSR family fosmidomycin resistance protein-like MFS transporter
LSQSALQTRAASGGGTVMMVILAISFCHLINDVLQSMLTALYPLMKDGYNLDFWQIGLLTLTFQCTASLLQPLVGLYTDKHPSPRSLPLGMASSLIGLVLLAFAHHYWTLLLGAAVIGIGSAIFHPESSRIARLASGGRHGFAQSTFQVGGNLGHALGPLLAAFIVVPRGQTSVAWFCLAAMVGILVLRRVSGWYAAHMQAAAKRPAPSRESPLAARRVQLAMGVLFLLVITKNIYTASLGSYYTFYLIEKFDVSVQASQVLLFAYYGASALGIFFGGLIGDRFGSKAVIWVSILGVLPFTLAMPYVGLTWTVALSILVGLILSSAFTAIVVFAQELMPGRVGMVAGVFFGFSFGVGGLAAAGLGIVADHQGIDYVFRMVSYLPLLGLLTVFLPRMDELR